MLLRLMTLVLAGSPVWGQCGILSWDEYRSVRHPFPYVLRFDAPEKLLMFGAQHTRDPHHPQLLELERL